MSVCLSVCLSVIIMIMYIYHALINALSAHTIQINLNTIFCHSVCLSLESVHHTDLFFFFFFGFGFCSPKIVCSRWLRSPPGDGLTNLGQRTLSPEVIRWSLLHRGSIFSRSPSPGPQRVILAEQRQKIEAFFFSSLFSFFFLSPSLFLSVSFCHSHFG